MRIRGAKSGEPVMFVVVYAVGDLRDYRGPALRAPRVMLHAFELGFEHPVTGERLRFLETSQETNGEYVLVDYVGRRSAR